MVVLVGYEMFHRVIMRAIMVNEKSPLISLGVMQMQSLRGR